MARPSPPPRPPQRTARPAGWTCRAEPLAECVVAVPKDKPRVSLKYRAAVRLLPCAACGYYSRGDIQFAHADVNGTGGKGIGLKSDDRLGYPACGPHPINEVMAPGCHHLIGTDRRDWPRERRRRFEAAAGERTRTAIRAAGLWPADLPAWPEDEQ